MKVFVNLPQTPEERKALANGVARFHATLMLEKIKKLNINDYMYESYENFLKGLDIRSINVQEN